MKPSRAMRIFKQVALRIIFLPLIFAFLLLATGTIVVHIMFTARDLEAIVTDQLQGFFKRPVQIDSARMSFTGEIKIKGLKVIEPGPEVMSFVTADYIYATYRLAPLLNRNIVLDSVVLVSPKIELIKHSSGNWNFSDILEAYKQPTEKKNRLNRITAAEIRDGIISVRTPGERYSFENVSLTLKDFEPDADTPFYLSVFFKRKALARDLEGRLYAEGAVNFSNFNMENAELKNLSLTFSAQNKSFKAEGGLKNFRRPDIRLTARTERLSDDDLAPVFKSPYNFVLPPARWTLKAKMTEDKTLNMSLFVSPPGLRAEGSLKFSTGAATVYDFTVFTPPFNLAELKKMAQDMPLTEASGIAQVRLSVNNRKGRFTLAKAILTSNKANFRYKNLHFDGLDLSALFSESFKNNYLNIQDGKLLMSRYTLTGLKVNTQLSRDTFTGGYSARWDGDPMKGRLVILNPLTDKKTADFTGYSRRLDIKEVRDFLLEMKKVRTKKAPPLYNAKLAWIKTVKNSIPSGFAVFRLLYKADFLKHEYFDARGFYLTANLKDIAGRIEKLKGDVAIKSGAGTFYNVQETSEQDRIYYIFSLPILTMYRLNRMGALKFGYKLNDVNFNSIGGEYTLDSGKIDIRNFYMAGKEFSIYTTGTLDLTNENIRLKVYTISDKYYSMGSLPETMTDASGKPALAFTIEGKMNKPAINMMRPMDAGNIIAEAIKKGVGIDSAKIDKFAGGK